MSEAKMYRRAQIATEAVSLNNPTSDVDHSRVRETGIALPDARGIETEAPTALAAQALSDERFMQDVLEVQFPEPGSEFDPQFVEAGVNGERVCIRRDGNTVKLKRCHVAVIAAAKQERLKQKKITLADGSMGYEEKMVLQPVYPFQVIYDPAGARGLTWLRQALQGV